MVELVNALQSAESDFVQAQYGASNTGVAYGAGASSYGQGAAGGYSAYNTQQVSLTHFADLLCEKATHRRAVVASASYHCIRQTDQRAMQRSEFA